MVSCVVSQALRRSFSAASPRPASTCSPDVAEAGSVEAIAKFTTETAIRQPVGRLRAGLRRPCRRRRSTSATSSAPPASCRGRRQIYGYFRELAKATPRVTVSVIGKSEEGRDILLVGHRGRGGHPRPRPAEGRDRGARRPAQDDARAGREDHRDGAADLLLQRRPPLDRDRQPRDGHGAGLPPGGLGAADDPGDPQERDRPDQPGLRAGRPRQDGRLVLPVPQGQDRLREPARERRRPTGATTSSTTTTATRTRRPSS